MQFLAFTQSQTSLLNVRKVFYLPSKTGEKRSSKNLENTGPTTEGDLFRVKQVRYDLILIPIGLHGNVIV